MKIPKLPPLLWFLVVACPLPGLWLLTLPLWGLHAINANARGVQIWFGVFLLLWVPGQVVGGVYRHIKFQKTIDDIKARGAGC